MVSMECKICSKKFSNGQALGGHMRTHFALLPVPPRTPQTLQQQPISPSYGLVVVDKETPKLDSNSKSGKRAKGLTSVEMTKMGSGLNELGMGGDDDDVAAWCLIMLSRDAWESSNGDELVKPVYRCERCEKVFKSSQGLGSHMQTHFKKIKNSFDHGDRVVRDDAARECPFCGKSFGSGQALGGHKKSHFGASRNGSIVN